MAPLDEPLKLSPADQAAMAAVAGARSHADGRTQLPAVYAALFHNPPIAEAVAALGEQIRFAGVLPDRTRELAILWFATANRLGYEWSHHQRPAALAGLTPAEIEEVSSGRIPDTLAPAEAAALDALASILRGESIPATCQSRLVAEYGTAGLVELVVLCGLYATMGYVTAAFDIEVEQGLPKPPF